MSINSTINEIVMHLSDALHETEKIKNITKKSKNLEMREIIQWAVEEIPRIEILFKQHLQTSDKRKVTDLYYQVQNVFNELVYCKDFVTTEILDNLEIFAEVEDDIYPNIIWNLGAVLDKTRETFSIK